MPSPLADHLAERFASDARALRARAQALRGPSPPAANARGGRAGGGRPAGRPAGPGVDATLRMAAACDRVEALFAGAADDAAARALLPTLAGLVAGAASEEERHVYAGAVSRLSDALRDDAGGGDADDDDDDGDEEDDG